MRAFAPIAAVALAAAGLAPGAVPRAHAESSSCTVVASLPATLSAPGRYCLDRNWTLALGGGPAIYVTADDVDLDCNDHAVRTTAPAGNSAWGLQATGARRNIGVRHCTFDGFEYGLYFDANGSGHRIEGNRILRAGSYGMYIAGSGVLVAGNTIATQRGGSSVYPTGLYLSGEPTVVTGNVVRGNAIVDAEPAVPSNAGSNGVSLRYQQGAVVEDNLVTAILSRTGAGTYGIVADHGSYLALRGNTVLATPRAAPFDGGNYYGILLQGTAGEQATNTCVDNVVGHFNTDVSGCVQSGTTGL